MQASEIKVFEHLPKLSPYDTPFFCISNDQSCQFMNLLSRFYLFSEALVRRTKDTVIEKGQK